MSYFEVTKISVVAERRAMHLLKLYSEVMFRSYMTFTKFQPQVHPMVLSGWYSFWANPATQPRAINTESRVV